MADQDSTRTPELSRTSRTASLLRSVILSKSQFVHNQDEMALWKKSKTVEELNEMCAGTIHDSLRISYVGLTPDSLAATMVVDSATKQPFGFLHGGASVVLIESLGSMASYLACEEGERVMGIEVNANHLWAVRQGSVTGTAKAISIGRTLHVWSVEILDDGGHLSCVGRLTVSIRAPKAPSI